MKAKICLAGIVVILGLASALPLGALPLDGDEPIIPPTISKVWPAGMRRGTTATFTLDGRNLSGARDVIFDAPGISGKVVEITNVPEKITGPRAGVDLLAQVPLGKKQTAKLEVTVAADVEPGVHHFRVQTPLGTSDMAVLGVGSLPEIPESEKPPGAQTQPQSVELPATIVGTIAKPGDTDAYEFDGKAGDQLVFQVVGSELGSQLESLLVLRDASGRELGSAGENDDKPDAVLVSKLREDGKYTLSITDREKGGGPDHFYRLNAGALPYVTGVFPLGVRSGQPSNVAVKGVNLDDIHEVKVNAPQSPGTWSTIPLKVKTRHGQPFDTVSLAAGNEPEMPEQEPNNTPAQAQIVALPVTINGRIDSEAAGTTGAADEDYFRFHAKKEERVIIEVAGSRLGSPLDSVIEILDEQGHSIPRATIRCLNQTTTTLADRDSRTEAFRLVSLSGLHEGDYLMVGDELDRIVTIPDQPDADVAVKGAAGLRVAFLGTSPDVHAINTPVYQAEILPPDANFPPNGLPVFHLVWRNDDGGPGFGADSKLDFIPPKDGDYIVHLKDVRGLGGPDFAYRLTLRGAKPDFQLSADPANPNIPAGGSVPLSISADRLEGYTGPIEIEVKGLPPGVTASRATIPEGQESTVVVLEATPGASPAGKPAPIKILGRAIINGREITRAANPDTPLQVASVIPPPDVLVTAEPRQVAIEPGKEVTVTLSIKRQNGFQGRVPCSVENLPPGVRVVNVGLNGVLVTESQSSRTVTLRAEDWAKPIDQPIYVVAQVESDSPTRHASLPVSLRIESKSEIAKAAAGQQGDGASPGRNAPNR